LRRYATLDDVHRAVVACTACPRLRDHCRQIARVGKREFRDWTYWARPVPGFGDPTARLHIVGLAPAAHGANRTGRMFTGDSSGNWLYDALHRWGFASQAVSETRDDGLRLRDCYISAAARCAPPANRPTLEELHRCQRFLEAELQLLRRARITLVLGHVAHRQWLEAAGWWTGRPAAARPHFAHGQLHRLPGNHTLLCSYHPSRQNTNTGRLTWRMWDAVFRAARREVDGA
jgi:uracil-DNA glycosylase family 4